MSLRRWTMAVLCLLTAPWHAWDTRRRRLNTERVYREHPDLAAFEATSRDQMRRAARERIAGGWLHRPDVRLDPSYRAFLKRVREEDAATPPPPPPR